MNKITIETIKTIEDQIIKAEIIDLVELNRIARNNCQGLTYLMNVMDVETTDCYMWFKDDKTETSYLVKLK